MPITEVMASTIDPVRPRAQDAGLALAFHHAPVAGVVLDAEGLILTANIAAEDILGDSAGSLEGQRFSDLVNADSRVVVQAALGDAVHATAPTIRRRDVALWPGVTDVATMHAGRVPDGTVVVQLTDPAESASGATYPQQRAFRTALLELSELSHSLIDDDAFFDALIDRAVAVVPGAQAGSILLNKEGTDEYHFVAARGFDLAGLQQRCLYENMMFRDVDTPEAAINRSVSEMPLPPDQETWMIEVGRIREIESNVSSPVFIGGEPRAFLSLDNFDDRDAFDATSVEMTTVLGRLIADLVRRRELESALLQEREAYRQLAMHDGLTGIANRRQLEASLAEAVAAAAADGAGVAVLFIDIDDFKPINDQLGHDVGDEVIRAVATGLQRLTRAGDIVGRWGGDEFMLIIPGIASGVDVRAVADRILEAFDGDLVASLVRSAGIDEEICCRLSIGAAWSTDAEVRPQDLVRGSDQALYAAKLAGKFTARILQV
ncbi:sensor domain-containing diguanylate cyclase [Euzebya tangerina]|uniref:sensor domain-containing diguanylate cyclase n=1 Tax=Euzebya tangerina TaxID=591198 RepID=UPI000E30BE56|nr:sensor domain-containing diguanylate cyclase [Euzebya tangerina]